MFLFLIEVTPKVDSIHVQDLGGAFAKCWIDFSQEHGAEHLARYYLEEEGWQPLQTEEVRFVEREDVEDDPQSLQYFMEAKVDGACFVFYKWPSDEEDDTE